MPGGGHHDDDVGGDCDDEDGFGDDDDNDYEAKFFMSWVSASNIMMDMGPVSVPPG